MAATSKIYLPDAKLVWVPADVLSSNDNTVRVAKYVPDPTIKLDDETPTTTEDVFPHRYAPERTTIQTLSSRVSQSWQ